MSAVLHPVFGNSATVRAAAIGNATFARAMNLGYGQVVARALAQQAKREAAEWETPNEVALRIVRPKSQSAAGMGTRGPGNAA